MAAEHEGPARAAEEISQLLYSRAGPHASPPTCPSTTSTGICSPPDPIQDNHASRRRAQQGRARRTRPRDPARGRVPRRCQPPRPRRAGPGQRRRVLLPAPARHRDLRGLAARSTWASPGSTCSSTAGLRPRTSCSTSGSPRRPSACGAVRGGRRPSRTLRANGSPRSYPGLLDDFLSRLRRRATVVKLDGAVENAVRLGVADAVADVVATGTTLRQAGLVESATRCWSARRCFRAPAPPRTPRCRHLRPPAPGRASPRAALRARRLRHPADARRGGRAHPGHRVAHRVAAAPTRAGSRSAPWSPREVHHIMDELYGLGARGILVTDIHACRL